MRGGHTTEDKQPRGGTAAGEKPSGPERRRPAQRGHRRPEQTVSRGRQQQPRGSPAATRQQQALEDKTKEKTKQHKVWRGRDT